ncbi:MAG: hypothetical protein QOE86_1620 [Solirubrobacteraceae bacterium]|nr:hypothetical protein [Solirubrobacteraceae bacterium]
MRPTAGIAYALDRVAGERLFGWMLGGALRAVERADG